MVIGEPLRVIESLTVFFGPSAAADKGLKQGDVILEVAGKSVSRPSEVAEAINAAKSDGKKSVLVRVKSNDGEHYLTLPTRAS